MLPRIVAEETESGRQISEHFSLRSWWRLTGLSAAEERYQTMISDTNPAIHFQGQWLPE
jgi:hypothetical protein